MGILDNNTELDFPHGKCSLNMGFVKNSGTLQILGNPFYNLSRELLQKLIIVKILENPSWY
jgi:hypothetical protein